MNARCLLASLLVGLPLADPVSTAEELSITFDQVTAIPDTSGATSVLVELEVPSSDLLRTVTEVRVALELDHPWVGDLAVKLESPGGSSATIFDRTGLVPAGFPGPFGCGGDDVDATFRDDAALSVDEVCSISTSPVLAGSLRPNQPFDGMNGLEPAGTWTVVVSDMQSGDSGVLRSVTLFLVVEPDCDGDGLPDECDCPADFNGDGVVGGPDLSVMLSGWGSDGVADLDGDGTVAGEDLARLLSSWGICD